MQNRQAETPVATRAGADDSDVGYGCELQRVDGPE